MPSWTYEVTDHPTAKDLEERLNSLSGRGFVLHSIVPLARTASRLIVKRAVDDPADRIDDPLDWLRRREDSDAAVVMLFDSKREGRLSD